MRKKLLNNFSKLLISILSVINFFQAKVVHAQMIYAPPEVFEREAAKSTILVDFIREYTGLVAVMSLLALVGLISSIRFIFQTIFKKKTQDSIISQSQQPNAIPKQ